jgi:hypothetical protein
MAAQNRLVIFEELGVNPGGVRLRWGRSGQQAVQVV